MADEKELMRKDLAMVLKLDAQIDYSQKVIVEKHYKDITRQGLLTTPYGKRYMRRLEQIINGDTVHNQCAFCNSQTQGDTLICPTCMAKLRKPVAVYCRNCGNKMNISDITCPVCGKNKDEGYKFCAHCGKEVPMPDMETLTNNVKNKSREFAEQAAKIAKENVQSIAEKGTKLAEDITADTKIVKEEKAKNENKSKERKSMNKKSILAWIAVLLTAVIIVGTIGLDTVFAFFAFVSLVVLAYKTVKKKPKRNAVIVSVVLLILSGMTGSLNNGMPNNVLDYIGTKESVVYRTYDKSDFYVEELTGRWKENERNNKSGLPHIMIEDGKVVHVILESGMTASLNACGLYIGDTVSQAEACMKKLNATLVNQAIQEYKGNLYGELEYSFRYNGKDMGIRIGIAENSISDMHVFNQ